MAILTPWLSLGTGAESMDAWPSWVCTSSSRWSLRCCTTTWVPTSSQRHTATPAPRTPPLPTLNRVRFRELTVAGSKPACRATWPPKPSRTDPRRRGVRRRSNPQPPSPASFGVLSWPGRNRSSIAAIHFGGERVLLLDSHRDFRSRSHEKISRPVFHRPTRPL